LLTHSGDSSAGSSSGEYPLLLLSPRKVGQSEANNEDAEQNRMRDAGLMLGAGGEVSP